MSEAHDADWIGTEEVKGSIPPWRKDPDGKSHRRGRQPMTWPVALVLLGLFVLAGFAAWLCAGVAKAWIAG